MIREMSLNDLNEINEIGNQIKDNFVKEFLDNLEDILMKSDGFLWALKTS